MLRSSRATSILASASPHPGGSSLRDEQHSVTAELATRLAPDLADDFRSLVRKLRNGAASGKSVSS